MLNSLNEILDELRDGRMVVLVDDENRENEGDLILPAQFVTPELVNFMVREAAGYLCLALTESDCDRLGLEPQASSNTSARGTPFTVSIDGHPRHGFTTGISADERARTIRLAINPGSTPADFVRPGHINPLRSRDGGVLVRIGHTEGSLDLCRLAGLDPAALIIEICKPDGSMARRDDLVEFCDKHNLKMCSIRQVIEHRLSRSAIVDRLEPRAGTTVQTDCGEFNLIAFSSLVDPLPHIALTVGGVGEVDDKGVVRESTDPTLVRVHRRDLLGDIFGVSDSGPATDRSLRASMQAIQKEGRGAIVYLRPTGVGDGLSQRLQRPVGGSDQEDSPAQSLPPAMLEYGVGSQILRALGLSKIRLLTASETAYPQLEAFGLEIVERLNPLA